MKHEKEIKELLDCMTENLRESWMTEDDVSAALRASMLLSGLTYEKMSGMIDNGIEKGYSVETQIKLCKKRIALEGGQK